MNISEIKDQLIKPVLCNVNDSVVKVAQILKEHERRHVFVTDDTGAPEGIISVTDISEKVVAEQKNPAELKAEDIMTGKILAVDTDHKLTEAYQEMHERNLISFPVLENGKIVGILTYDILMMALIRHEKNKGEQ